MASCAACNSDVQPGTRWCPICHSNLLKPTIGRLASPGKRLGAYVLDVVVPIVALFFIFGIGGLGAAAGGQRAGGGIGCLLMSGLLLAYIIVALRLFGRGTTPGKKLLSMYVIKEDGQLAGFGTMLFREWIGKAISGAVLLLGYLWILLDKDRQGWHDKLASTYVVERPPLPVLAGAATGSHEASEQPAMPSQTGTARGSKPLLIGAAVLALVLAAAIAIWVGRHRPRNNTGLRPSESATEHPIARPPSPIASRQSGSHQVPPAVAAAAQSQPPPRAVQKAGVAFLGVFSNAAELKAHFNPKAEMRAPYTVILWQDSPSSVVGHVSCSFAEIDTPVGPIEGSGYNPASGGLAFQAHLPDDADRHAGQIHEFSGSLKGDILEGTFVRHSDLYREQVVLKKLPAQSTSYLESYRDLASWQEKYSKPILKFRGPK